MNDVSLTSPARTPAVPRRVYGILAAGVIAVSLAAIFIRYAQLDGVPSLVIAAGRLVISALILTPLALARHRGAIAALPTRKLLLAAASGVFLGLHFALWITSLEYTTVLISVVFVSTGPLWVALLEFIFLRVRPTPGMLAGLGLAIAGGMIIGLSGAQSADAPQPLLGAVLALGGAAAVAAYLVIGRSVRRDLALIPYIWLVYGSGAIFLCLLLLVTQTPVAGYSPSGYFWVLLTALVPQLIGHSSFNYALRYLSATYVSIATQLEPLGSAVAAFIVFRQVPTGSQILGSIAIIFGVGLASARPAAQLPADQPASEKPM